MVTLKVECDKKTGFIVGYKVEGHVGLEKAGKDIICAAVSVMTQIPILSLEKQLNRHPQYSFDDGVLMVKLDKVDDLSQLLLRSMVLGMEDLSRKYPKYVRIEEQR